jgi:SecD/SecF fusion protein
MNPYITFFAGTILLLLWFFYVGTAGHNLKRNLGTMLSVLMGAFFVWAYSSEGIKKGIDLQGGSEFVVQLQPGVDDKGAPKPVSEVSRQQAMAILDKRLSDQGTKDLQLQPAGDDRIIIQMPGVKPEDMADVKRKIQQVAKLEFRIANDNSAAELERIKTNGGVAIGFVEMPMRDQTKGEKSLLVRNRADLEGKYVSSAHTSFDAEGWKIYLNMNSEGAELFDKVAAQNQYKRMAIIIDGEIISAPTLQTNKFGGTAVISGDFKEAEARTLTSVLENPLENSMAILSQSEVSPTFGADTIKQGVMSGIAALVVTALFMSLYYRLAGAISLIGLVLTALITFGAMAVFQFTMTMPGIAGIVLTVGMAVDANVLIYERLREEMASGKSLAASIEAAHERAFSAIFDSNITTLITSVILFILGSGVIKGFAITLSIGVVATLFGALVVTRVMLTWLLDGGILKHIKVLRIIPDRIFDVMSFTRRWSMISLAAVAVCILIFPFKGMDSLGIDFKGGSKVAFGIADGKNITEAEALAALKGVQAEKTEAGKVSKVDIGSVRYQQSNSPTGQIVTLRGSDFAGAAIKASIEDKFKDRIKSSELETIGSVIGGEMAKKSIIAVIAGLIGIFLYLVLRFETSFAVGAIVALIHDCIITAGGAVLMGQELSLLHISAVLTIAGYSVNDTIVIFDRLREVIKGGKKGNIRDLMNEAISATMSRTLLTSAATLCSVIVLMVLGGPSMREFSIPIFIGMIAGVYSTVFIAAPVVLWWARRTGTSLHRQVLDSVEMPPQVSQA